MNKYKTFALFLVVGIALMSFAATASATTLTSSSGTYTGTIKAANEGAISLHGPVTLTCNKSSLESNVEQHGNAVTAKGNISSLSFTECNHTVEVVTKGRLEFHGLSGSNGTVTAPGLLITVEFTTGSGTLHCVFGSTSADIGTLTAASTSSGHAVIDLDAALISVAGGDEDCGSTGELTGKYKITSPTGLKVDSTISAGTSVTSSSGTTPTIKAESEGETTFDGIVAVTCDGMAFQGMVESHGASVTAKGNLSSLTFTSCGGDTVIVKTAGSFEVHASGSGNGTLTSSGTEVTFIADTIFGNIHCIFTTSSTHIGTITGATSGTGHATMHIDAAQIPRTGGNSGGLCGSSAEWTGSFKFNSPTGLSFD